jgi:Domain of unknown function (DUF4440)
MMSMTDYFRELEGSRIRALVERDMELLWRLHAEEYQLVTPSGRTFGRERYLREIESGNLQYWRWDAGLIEVRATERMAIVRYQATLELGSAGGHGTPFQCWHTDSYELKNGHWQAVWSQATAIRGPD